VVIVSSIDERDHLEPDAIRGRAGSLRLGHGVGHNLLVPPDGDAGVVQWQNISFPS
jgi:hypothetical protein